jgi:DNA-binding transcriptional regulator GbsR (MarR family)
VTKLSPTQEKFIVRWGEMGGMWGINRATAQIVALLYLSPDPLTAEEIADTLAMARSTVSTDLRELQNWGVVNVVHVLGDRRHHFETIGDPAELFRVVVRERRRREIDPLVRMLRESAGEHGEGAFVRDRMRHMLDFLEVACLLHDRSEALPTDTLLSMARQAGRLPLKTALKLAQLGDGFGAALKRLAK